jgi:hypothetical protein
MSSRMKEDFTKIVKAWQEFLLRLGPRRYNLIMTNGQMYKVAKYVGIQLVLHCYN